MASRIKISGGIVTCVYDDRFRDLLEKMGTSTIQRATDVEPDEKTGEWVACLRTNSPGMPGEEIARDRNRNSVIDAEVAYLEARL